MAQPGSKMFNRLKKRLLNEIEEGENKSCTESNELISVSRISENILDPMKERIIRERESFQPTMIQKPNPFIVKVEDLADFSGAKTRGTRKKLKAICTLEEEAASGPAVRRGRGRPRGSGKKKNQGPQLQKVVKKEKRVTYSASEVFNVLERFANQPKPIPASNIVEALEPKDYLINAPPGVMGSGKGDHKFLPKYEFKSLYQYVIPSKNSKNPTPWAQDPVVPPENLKLVLLSVVASASLGIPLNLGMIAEKGTNLSYDPQSFTPLVMRLKSPTATGMFFKSGKMVVTGTKSEEECKIAAEKFARNIKRLGFSVRLLGFRIQNVSATCSLPFRVRIHLLGGDRTLLGRLNYHPELFTGVSLPLIYPKATVMVFRTGSVLITGVKTAVDAKKALEVVYPSVRMYAN